jgi:hypothetical protein
MLRRREAYDQKAIASLQSRQLRRLRLHQRQRLHQAVRRQKPPAPPRPAPANTAEPLIAREATITSAPPTHPNFPQEDLTAGESPARGCDALRKGPEAPRSSEGAGFLSARRLDIAIIGLRAVDARFDGGGHAARAQKCHGWKKHPHSLFPRRRNYPA